MSKLRVHPAGWALMALLTVTGQGARAWMALLALLLHEGAHLLAMRCLGMRAGRVELTPFGGVMEADAFEEAPPGDQALAAAAGALGSLAAGALLYWLGNGQPALAQLARINLWLGACNLLPILPLDGGRAVQALTGGGARRLLTGFGVAAGCGLLLLALYGAWHGVYNLTLLFCGPYLCYAARRCALTQQARLLEQSLRMRERLRRHGNLRVEAVACPADADRSQLLRALLDRPGDRYRYLVMIDPAEGTVSEVVEEREALRRLLRNAPAYDTVSVER